MWRLYQRGQLLLSKYGGQSKLFHHHLELEQDLWSMHIFIALRSNIWPMYCSSSSLDNFCPEDNFLAYKLCQKNSGAYMIKIDTVGPSGLIGIYRQVVGYFNDEINSQVHRYYCSFPP